jgi:hypothetical protein
MADLSGLPPEVQDALAQLNAEVAAVKEAMAAMKPVLEGLVQTTEQVAAQVEADAGSLIARVREDLAKVWHALHL